MFSKKLLHISQLSAIGLAGYYLGSHKQATDNSTSEDCVTVNGRIIKSLPCLPVFATVSAATPFSDSGSKDRVSFLHNDTAFLKVLFCAQWLTHTYIIRNV